MLAGTGVHNSGDQPTSLDLLHMGIRLLTATLLHSHGAFSGWAGETSSSVLQFQYNSVTRVQGAASLHRVSGLERERFIVLCLAACFCELGAPIKPALRHFSLARMCKGFT